MNYEFSFGAFFLGFIILGVGVALVRFHQTIADNLGSGVSSYDSYKLYALITCGVGFLVMTNLASFILINLLQSIFPRLG